jgi:Cu(I)/Ag(I) efflux system membrane fusion protein
VKTAVKSLATVAAVVAAAGAGLWAGQTGQLRLPLANAPNVDSPIASGAVVYYRDPDGKPFYALAPKMSNAGKAYIPVRASEDVTFDKARTALKSPAAGEKKVKFYRNPMGLPDTSLTPKKDSMGMDYIPVYEGEIDDGSTVQISPGKIQRTGVETVVIGRRPIVRTIKAPGVVQLDERRVAVVAPRFDGYVESVGSVTTGTHVVKGDVLAKVFGQEVLNEAARLLVEQGSAARPAGGLIGATRRLRNLGVPEEFMDQVKRERRVPDTFALRAPIDGEVLERNWSDGQGFKAGDVGFRIADHSLVWVMADVAEGDMDAVKPGQAVKVTTRAHPGRAFIGAVTVVYPHLMKQTRTVRVRIELPNPDLALLPDMYSDVEIATGNNESVLAVPASAIIDDGSRQMVLRDEGNGRFSPREIKSGRHGDGYVEVLNGLREGDSVVVNGNFLIDAESNLQSALKGFGKPSGMEASQ